MEKYDVLTVAVTVHLRSDIVEVLDAIADSVGASRAALVREILISRLRVVRPDLPLVTTQFMKHVRRSVK